MQLSAGTLIVPNNWLADQLASAFAAIVVGAVFGWLLVRLKAAVAVQLSSPRVLQDTPVVGAS